MRIAVEFAVEVGQMILNLNLNLFPSTDFI
jgi:hypothetical protein